MSRIRFCKAAYCLATSLFLVCAAYAAPGNTSGPQQILPLQVGKATLVQLNQVAHTVFVAQPEIASYQVPSSNRLLIFGRRTGTTTLFALNASGAVIYSAEIKVEHDMDAMHSVLKKEFPGLNLSLTSTLDGISVSGKVPDPQTAAQVIAILDSFVRIDPKDASQDNSSSGEDVKSGTGRGKGTAGTKIGRVINRLTVDMPNQVTIRIRIAEVSRNLSDRLGFKWQALGGGIGFSESPIMFPNMAGSQTPIENGFKLLRGDKPDIAGLLDALAEEKLVSILAEPNLSVMSGETASFLAGGQIPFPVLQDRNVGIEFRDFGVLLGITPTVLSSQRISLKVKPEVSQPNYNLSVVANGFRIPGFTVRRAETTVELASGQSFALAGLLQSNITEAIAKFPGLGDVPILGALARSKSFQRDETELVIIATAYLAQPGNDALVLPNAQAEFGNAFERLLLDKKIGFGSEMNANDQSSSGLQY